jgi:hypothetical protein
MMVNRRQFAGQEGGMPPGERRRRDWRLHFQVTGPPIKPPRPKIRMLFLLHYSIEGISRADGAQAGACPLPNLRITVPTL